MPGNKKPSQEKSSSKPKKKKAKPKKIQVTDLPREQLLQYYDYIQEMKRRKRENRDAYSPNDGQSMVHSSLQKIRLVSAGNGGGKSCLAVHEAIWAAQGYNPHNKEFTKVPAKVIVLLDSPDKVGDVWMPEIRKWFNTEKWELRKNGKPFYNEILMPNGSSVKFMFSLQEPMAFESIELDFFVADEPFPRHVWISLLRGGRKKGRSARYLLIQTPIAGTWIRKEVYEPWENGERDDIECFRFGTVVNEKNLSTGYIESFSRNLTERERKIRLEGEFWDLDGLALAHLFDRDIHVIPKEELPEIVLTSVAIDPHPNKDHVAILLGCDRDGLLYYLDEIASKSVPRLFARELKSFYQDYPVFDIVCDSLGSTPMSGGEGNRSFIEVLQDEGIRVRATTYEDKKDESWITRIQDVLMIPEFPNNFGQCTPKLRIVDGNHKIVRDVETVAWQKIRNDENYKPKLDIAQKDYLACLKYALATNLSPSRKKDKIWVRREMPASYGASNSKAQRAQRLKPRKIGSMYKRHGKIKNEPQGDDW